MQLSARTAFCLHEMKRTEEAHGTLLNGLAALRDQAVYYYNLACYKAQLCNVTEAKHQLHLLQEGQELQG